MMTNHSDIVSEMSDVGFDGLYLSMVAHSKSGQDNWLKQPRDEEGRWTETVEEVRAEIAHLNHELETAKTAWNSPPPSLRLSAIRPGIYVNRAGTWAVAGDGADSYVSQSGADSEGISSGLNTSAEWEVLYMPGGGMREGSNTDYGKQIRWVGTLREGRRVVFEQATLRGENPRVESLKRRVDNAQARLEKLQNLE